MAKQEDFKPEPPKVEEDLPETLKEEKNRYSSFSELRQFISTTKRPESSLGL
jgi:hypothetical protein